MRRERRFSEMELAACLRFPLPLWGLLIERAHLAGYRRHAAALQETARMVAESGVPQANGMRAAA